MSAVARRAYVRGVEALRRGDHDVARDELRAALDLAPTFIAARIAYASLLARLGDRTRAAQLLRDALDDQGARQSQSDARVLAGPPPKTSIALHRTLGDVLIATGDYRGAEQAFQRAAEAGARAGIPQTDLHDRLARLRAKTGRFAEALDELLAASRPTICP